jgi:drug/metabolite transporter (DMT)-like permease
VLTAARRSEAALLLVTAAWGLTFPLVKGALAEAPAFPFLGVRTFVGLVLVAGLFRFRVPGKAALPMGALLGALLVLSYAFQTVGLEHTTATRSAFITGLSVVGVALLHPLVTRRAPDGRAWLGTVLAVAGLWIFTQPGRGGVNLGDWLTMGCAVAYAVYVIVLERVPPRVPVADLVLVQAGCLAAAFVPFAVTGWDTLRWGPGLTWGIGVTAPVLAYSLWGLTRHQSGTTAPRAALIYAAEPVFAASFAWVLLGETLTPKAWAGAAVIMTGILFAVWRPKPGAIRGG